MAQCWAAGQKAKRFHLSLYLQTMLRWHALHHRGTWPFHWIHLPGTPGYPPEKQKRTPQTEKQNFLPWIRLMAVVYPFSNYAPDCELQPDKNHGVRWNRSEENPSSKSGILLELITLTLTHFTKFFSLYFMCAQAFCSTGASYVVCGSGKDSKFMLNSNPTEAFLYTEEAARHSSQKKQAEDKYLCVHFSPHSPEILLLQFQQWYSLPWFAYSNDCSPSTCISYCISWVCVTEKCSYHQAGINPCRNCKIWALRVTPGK